MGNANRHNQRDKPPEIISYYTMRRSISILGISLPPNIRALRRSPGIFTPH